MKEQATSQRYLEAVERIKDVISGMLAVISSAYEAEGRTFNYSSDFLRSMANYNLVDFQRSGREHVGWTYLMNISVAEGAILGETIIQNLGGEWVYPSYSRIAAFGVLRSIGIPLSVCGRIMFPKIQVRLNGKLIPVMTIGRLRVKWDDRVFSLAKAYEEIRITGEWTGKAVLTPLEKRILWEKRWIWRNSWWGWRGSRGYKINTLNRFKLQIMIDREATRTADIAGGVDYSQDGLKKIDEYFSKKSLKEKMKEPKIAEYFYGDTGARNLLLSVTSGVGGYFGETIVRCLGGKWVFPSNEEFLIGFKLHEDMKFLHDRTYVRFKGNLIPVMTIAQMRLEDKIPSLADVYEKIRTTGKWE